MSRTVQVSSSRSQISCERFAYFAGSLVDPMPFCLQRKQARLVGNRTKCNWGEYYAVLTTIATEHLNLAC